LTTTTPTADLRNVDLSEADEFESGPPHEIFARLRAEAPVHRNRSREEADFWSVTRYEDVESVLRDSETFASGRPIAFMHDEKSILPVEVLQGMMVNQDPPRHTRSRKIVRSAFTPPAMQAFAPQIAALCEQLVDGIRRARRVRLRRRPGGHAAARGDHRSAGYP
jgi:cytochrome P450